MFIAYSRFQFGAARVLWGEYSWDINASAVPTSSFMIALPFFPSPYPSRGTRKDILRDTVRACFMDQTVGNGGFERIRGYSFPSVSFPSFLFIEIATSVLISVILVSRVVVNDPVGAQWWYRRWWEVLCVSARGWCPQEREEEYGGKERERERERGERLPCTRDFQFITTDLPRQFDAAPTLDERRHMSIAAAENAGWVSLRSICLGHNYHLSRESTRRPNRIKSVSLGTMAGHNFLVNESTGRVVKA